MSETNAYREKLVREGAMRLLERATDSRALDISVLSARMSATLEKYLLRDEPDASPRAIEKFLGELHADDLCLAVACERGDEAAWADLIERFGATVRSAARSATSSADAAEDLAQSIWAELYGLRATEAGEASGKLAHYSGRGSLGGWLRAVVGQLAIDRHRRSSRLVQMETEAEGDRCAHERQEKNDHFNVSIASTNPERALAEGQAASDVHAALASAISELDNEDRLLIKLYYFDDLRLREAGALLGVHEATASRRLSKLHEGMRQRVQTILMKQHGWTQREVQSSLSETAAHLDGDISRMLTTEAISNETNAPRNKTF